MALWEYYQGLSQVQGDPSIGQQQSMTFHEVQGPRAAYSVHIRHYVPFLLILKHLIFDFTTKEIREHGILWF